MRRRFRDHAWMLAPVCLRTGWGFVLSLACVLCGNDLRLLADDAAKGTASDSAYAERVRPLLQKYCFECHAEKSTKIAALDAAD